MPYKDKGRQRAASRESARRRRAARRALTEAAAGATRWPVEPSNQPAGLTPADLARVIAAEINIIRGSVPAGSLERSRVLVLLVGAGLRCFETANLLARVEALERAYEDLGDHRGVLHAV